MRRRSACLGLTTALVLVGCVREWDAFEFEDDAATGGVSGDASGATGGTGAATAGGATGGGTGGTSGGDAGGGGTGATIVTDCGSGDRDGTETDVDCGGGDCLPCTVGQTCLVDGDCNTSRCESGTCMIAECPDGRANGNETDVDCGGANCPPCDVGQACAIDNDCVGAEHASGACTNDECAIECDLGWQNCRSDSPDCETNIHQDFDSCGVCFNGCLNDHGGATCTTGVCSMLSCDGGWDDCSVDENVDRDGCETDLNATPEHCGQCGNPCGAGSTCREGSCCSPVSISESIQMTQGTCFRIVPDRCDCQFHLQLNGTTGGAVWVQIDWDAGGSANHLWTAVGTEIAFTPASAFTAVITGVESIGARSLNWWTESCAGTPVECLDSTQTP